MAGTSCVAGVQELMALSPGLRPATDDPRAKLVPPASGTRKYFHQNFELIAEQEDLLRVATTLSLYLNHRWFAKFYTSSDQSPPDDKKNVLRVFSVSVLLRAAQDCCTVRDS